MRSVRQAGWVAGKSSDLWGEELTAGEVGVGSFRVDFAIVDACHAVSGPFKTFVGGGDMP